MSVFHQARVNIKRYIGGVRDCFDRKSSNKTGYRLQINIGQKHVLLVTIHCFHLRWKDRAEAAGVADNGDGDLALDG